MSTQQSIEGTFLEGLGRMPTGGEVGMFLNSSDYALNRYVWRQPEYANSNVYKDRYVQIQEASMLLWGFQQDPAIIDGWIRADVSDDQIVYGWRQTGAYKNEFRGKPEYMTETEYRKTKEKLQVERDETVNDFRTYLGKQITDDDLRSIYMGGIGAEPIRRQWTQVQRLKASYDATRGKLSSGKVKQTPLGPIQPALGGIDAAATTGKGGLNNSKAKNFMTMSYKEFQAEGLPTPDESIDRVISTI